MNFNIIENSPDDYNLEEIIRDYTNLKLTVDEIRKKHNLSQNQWRRIIKEMKDNGLPLRDRRRKSTRKGKYYYYDKKTGLYLVCRIFKGKFHRFGYFETAEEAEARVKRLKENNWEGLISKEL